MDSVDIVTMHMFSDMICRTVMLQLTIAVVNHGDDIIFTDCDYKG